MTSMESMESRPGYLTAEQVMDMLHIRSKQTLYRYLAEGLPSHQVRSRGRRLFDPAEVRQWVDSRWTERSAGESA